MNRKMISWLINILFFVVAECSIVGTMIITDNINYVFTMLFAMTCLYGIFISNDYSNNNKNDNDDNNCFYNK